LDRTSRGDADPLVTVIEPTRGWRLPDFRELFEYRDVLAFFVRRDIKVRYRQTFLGGAWAILQPLLTMVMLTIIFDRLAGVSSDGVPYPLFSLAGLVLWTYVTRSIAGASSSIESNSQLIEKVYFPRLLIPLSAALSGLLDLAVSFLMLLLVTIIFWRVPGVSALLCIPVALITALASFAISLPLAALTVRFRDVAYVVPFGIQLAFFITPIAYPASLVPEEWRGLLGINPVAGPVELFRWALLGTHTNPWPLFFTSMASLIVILVAGLLIFKRMERGFADII
jgi:lipopolysaccharide transport system permease protein